MSKTKKYTIFKTNNLDFNTVSFFVRQTAKHSTKTMPLNPLGSPMAAKRTNKNQHISCLPNEKTLPLQSKEIEKQ